MAQLELYLIRHGVAADPQRGQSDDDRPLTPEGVERLREEAAGLEALDVVFDLVLTSPLLRARQTADTLLEGMKGRPPVIVTETLVPSGAPENVISEVTKHLSRSRIALVGHEPSMSELAARLLRARGSIPFKKGSVCCVDFDTPPPQGNGNLRWFATPKMLRLLGRGQGKD